jgi:ATP-binding cassette, subfamily F, member 3
VMDEPTNHLDMLSKDMLKQAIQEFDGTLLVVSHDRDFLAGLTTRTMEFRDGNVIEYLGDINYFLDKRALDNMRDVEKRNVAKAVAAAPVVSNLSSEDKKHLQRTVQRSEKRISELEADIKKMELLMADPNFYTQPDNQKQISKYQGMQSELEKVMEEWDAAVGQLA